MLIAVKNINNETFYLNTLQIASIEKDSDTGNAIVEMVGGAIYPLNESFDSLIAKITNTTDTTNQ